MFTTSDFKEIPVSAQPNGETSPHQDFAFFRRHAEHPMRLNTTTFEPVNAWWLMELCLLAYTGEEFTSAQLDRIGFQRPRFFGDAGKFSAQAMVTANDECIFVVFRGTEAHKLADVIIDIDALPGFTRDGYVHAGFARALNRAGCWNEIQAYLKSVRDNRKIYFTGHSMGAAVVTIAAQQFRDRHEREFQLYTFGSPRVGGLTFKHRFGPFPSFRVVNDRDAVPHLPPPPIYWHVPELVHIGPRNSLIRRNMFTGLRGAAAHLTLGIGDFRLTREERHDHAEQILIPEHPKFDKKFLRPVSHHNPRMYATKVWNHYVWTELHKQVHES
jgi:triacylglycerol lipase